VIARRRASGLQFRQERLDAGSDALNCSNPRLLRLKCVNGRWRIHAERYQVQLSWRALRLAAMPLEPPWLGSTVAVAVDDGAGSGMIERTQLQQQGAAAAQPAAATRSSNNQNGQLQPART